MVKLCLFVDGVGCCNVEFCGCFVGGLMIILYLEKYWFFEGSGIFFGCDGEVIFFVGFLVFGLEVNCIVVKIK